MNLPPLRFTGTLLTTLAICGGCAIVASCAAPTTPSATLPATLPTAQQVIDRYIEVTGGRAAYESIKSRRQVGTVDIPAQGVRGVTRSAVTRERGKLTSTLDSIGTVIQGFDHDLAYAVDPSTGARLLSGDEKNATIQQLTINAEIDLAGFLEARVTGIDTYRDKPCYRLALTTAAGQEIVRLYEVESGLLVRASAPVPSLGKGVQMVVTYADYQPAPPIQRAMFTRMQVGTPGIVVVETRFTKVEHNVEMDDDELAPPDAVKQLNK
ncbi:MAG: hypothetical protein QM770_11175 [Tepidisphaeraceae bacterium]